MRLLPSACSITELGPNELSRVGFCANICAATELTYLLPTTMRVEAGFAAESSTARGVVAVDRTTGVTALATLGVAVTFASPVPLQLVVVKLHFPVTFAMVTLAMFVDCPIP